MATDRELEEVLRIPRAAERCVRDIYATAFTVELKGPGDPVTRADREALRDGIVATHGALHQAVLTAVAAHAGESIRTVERTSAS